MLNHDLGTSDWSLSASCSSAPLVLRLPSVFAELARRQLVVLLLEPRELLSEGRGFSVCREKVLESGKVEF